MGLATVFILLSVVCFALANVSPQEGKEASAIASVAATASSGNASATASATAVASSGNDKQHGQGNGHGQGHGHGHGQGHGQGHKTGPSTTAPSGNGKQHGHGQGHGQGHGTEHKKGNGKTAKVVKDAHSTSAVTNVNGGPTIVIENHNHENNNDGLKGQKLGTVNNVENGVNVGAPSYDNGFPPNNVAPGVAGAVAPVNWNDLGLFGPWGGILHNEYLIQSLLNQFLNNFKSFKLTYGRGVANTFCREVKKVCKCNRGFFG